MQQFWKAYDGKEFSSELDCRKYEIGIDEKPTITHLKLWTKDGTELWNTASDTKEIYTDRFSEAKYAEFENYTGVKVFNRLYFIQNRAYAPAFVEGDKVYYDTVANEWVNFNVLKDQYENADKVFNPTTTTDDE